MDLRTLKQGSTIGQNIGVAVPPKPNTALEAGIGQLKDLLYRAQQNGSRLAVMLDRLRGPVPANGNDGNTVGEPVGKLVELTNLLRELDKVLAEQTAHIQDLESVL